MDTNGVRLSGEVLLTNFELLRILQGDLVDARTSDGQDITVRPPAAAKEAGGVRFPGREVFLADGELLRILQGDLVGARTSDGQDITVRLPTPDELLDSDREARERLAETMKSQPGWSPPPLMTRAQAEDLTRPYQEP
jgi:translation initiation factor IF-1